MLHYTERYDVKIYIARLHQHARETLDADGVLAELGEDHIFDSVHAAVAAAKGPAPTTPSAASDPSPSKA